MKKNFFLILATIFIGAFFILESSQYFQSFYPEQAWRAFWLAIILDGACVVLCLIKPKAEDIRFLKGIILTGLFLIIVFSSAAFHVGKLNTPKISDTDKKLIESLEKQIDAENQTAARFGVKTYNHAWAVQNARKLNAQLILTLEKADKQTASYFITFNIALVIAIRLVLQLANLFIASAITMSKNELQLEIKPNIQNTDIPNIGIRKNETVYQETSDKIEIRPEMIQEKKQPVSRLATEPPKELKAFMPIDEKSKKKNGKGILQMALFSVFLFCFSGCDFVYSNGNSYANLETLKLWAGIIGSLTTAFLILFFFFIAGLCFIIYCLTRKNNQQIIFAERPLEVWKTQLPYENRIHYLAE